MCLLVHTSKETKLSAGNHAINYVPQVITDSAPGILVAHLHTSLHVI